MTIFAEETHEESAGFRQTLVQGGSGHVELLSAGQGPLIIYRAADKSLQCIGAQAVPLGVLPELEGSIPLHLSMNSGDLLLLVTDGFLEWENPAQEEFGSKRLAEVLTRFSDREPEVIIVEIYNSVRGFSQGTPQKDDLTAVLIKAL